MMRGAFAKDVITMDLSGLGLQRTDEDLYRDHYKMLTLGQLSYGLDSLGRQRGLRQEEQAAHLRNSLFLLRLPHAQALAGEGPYVPTRAWLDSLPPQARLEGLLLIVRASRPGERAALLAELRRSLPAPAFGQILEAARARLSPLDRQKLSLALAGQPLAA